jgi:hypothetical protein
MEIKFIKHRYSHCRDTDNKGLDHDHSTPEKKTLEAE